ncbi:MAG TPA: helix-turn-helix transcriptional regulator [Solirubrobacteraceae bacterium]|nr:helix-turn-helix transcriptional regulator [Solirubrobacteraceae bacterium]
MDGRLQRAFGRSLKVYRRRLGLSQEAFADVLGVHRTYLGGIERGEHNLTLKSVERIAAKIGIDPMALLRSDSVSSTGEQPKRERAQVRG